MASKERSLSDQELIITYKCIICGSLTHTILAKLDSSEQTETGTFNSANSNISNDHSVFLDVSIILNEKELLVCWAL